MKKVLSVLLLFIGCSNIPKTSYYNYTDLKGKKHIFNTDIYKLKDTDHFFCFECDRLHKLEIKRYSDTMMMVDSAGTKHFYEYLVDNANNWCYNHNKYEYVESLKTFQE